MHTLDKSFPNCVFSVFSFVDDISAFSDHNFSVWWVGSSSGCCWAEKSILLVSELSILWLSLCLKRPVIWSYHSLALALSHWKINKLLVAYPPSLAILAHHSSVIVIITMIIDYHFAIVVLTDRMNALSLYCYIENEKKSCFPHLMFAYMVFGLFGFMFPWLLCVRKCTFIWPPPWAPLPPPTCPHCFSAE